MGGLAVVERSLIWRGGGGGSVDMGGMEGRAGAWVGGMACVAMARGLWVGAVSGVGVGAASLRIAGGLWC